MFKYFFDSYGNDSQSDFLIKFTYFHLAHWQRNQRRCLKFLLLDVFLIQHSKRVRRTLCQEKSWPHHSVQHLLPMGTHILGGQSHGLLFAKGHLDHIRRRFNEVINKFKFNYDQFWGFFNFRFLSHGKTGKVVEDIKEKREVLLDAFVKYMQKYNKSYVIRALICEQLYLVVLLFLWFATDAFLRGQVMPIISIISQTNFSTSKILWNLILLSLELSAIFNLDFMNNPKYTI